MIIEPGNTTREEMSMSSFLLIWNPRKSKWIEPDERDSDGSYVLGWSCGQRKNLPVGSRVFLMRVGESPKGIIGMGDVIEEPAYGHFEDEEFARAKGTALFVTATWSLLQQTPLIPIERLQEPPFEEFNWTPQGSGIQIPDEIAWHLEEELAKV